MPDGAKSKKNKKNKSGKAMGDKPTTAEPDDPSEKPGDTPEPQDSNDAQPDPIDEKPADIKESEGSDKNKEHDGNQTKKPADNGEGDNTSHETSYANKEPDPPGETGSEDRFEALVRDRDSLRAEVTDMRKSLEEIQSKHRSEMEGVQGKLDDAETKREHAEAQFQKLMERVNTIKSQLGERLKEDSEEIAQAKSKIEGLEEENSQLKATCDSKSSELADASRKAEQHDQELSAMRDRTSLSQQNWLEEKDELIRQESYLQSEFEQAKEAMHNWEVLAMEERSIRENMGEKIADLEEQLAGLRDAYDKAAAEHESQTTTVDGLQRALQDIQAARKQELRELAESSDTQLEELRRSVNAADTRASEADKTLQTTQDELERLRPFEKEVKEKNLLIGKLRHEAVTLNDHLTKALRFLRKGKPEDNVDRHIVTNHLLHFLALDRSDPKKFQILQLIAALLGWTDEQREQAGLARPGTSNASGKLSTGSTPVPHTPSTPTLATEFMDNGTTSKESLAELWSDFLEQESQAGQGDGQQSRNHGTPK